MNVIFLDLDGVIATSPLINEEVGRILQKENKIKKLALTRKKRKIYYNPYTDQDSCIPPKD